MGKITAQITASITKPSPARLVKSVPTKQQQDDEALVDMIEKMDKEKINKTSEEAKLEGTSDNIVELVEKDSKEKSRTIVDSEEIVGKDGATNPANEKVVDPTLMTLSQKFEDMGFESLDKIVIKK